MKVKTASTSQGISTRGSAKATRGGLRDRRSVWEDVDFRDSQTRRRQFDGDHSRDVEDDGGFEGRSRLGSGSYLSSGDSGTAEPALWVRLKLVIEFIISLLG